LLAASATLLTRLAIAQDPLRGLMTMGFGDVAAIKQKAEAGDAKAQAALAGTLAHNWHSAEALEWYRKAADQGNTEAACQVGSLLLFGALGIPREQTVEANPTERLAWTFRAATNHRANAWWNMSKAFINGKTLGEGESAKFPVKPAAVVVKCIKIEKDSVLVAIEGEDAPRWLRLK
jgi:TPR repeat protein